MHAVQFAGFLPPHGGKRTKRLQALLHTDVPFIVYESPHRISKLIEEIAHHCPSAFLIVGREMTKLHEEFWYSTAQDLLADLPQKKLLGEFAILVQTNC
jgi:16S rRNA (cytidine1402-2'-O)-methyltransferase